MGVDPVELWTGITVIDVVRTGDSGLVYTNMIPTHLDVGTRGGPHRSLKPFSPNKLRSRPLDVSGLREGVFELSVPSNNIHGVGV